MGEIVSCDSSREFTLKKGIFNLKMYTLKLVVIENHYSRANWKPFNSG